MPADERILKLENEVANLRSVCLALLEATVTSLAISTSAVAENEDHVIEQFEQFKRIRQEIYDKLGLIHG